MAPSTDTNWLADGVYTLALVLAGSGLGWLGLACRIFDRSWYRHTPGESCQCEDESHMRTEHPGRQRGSAGGRSPEAA